MGPLEALVDLVLPRRCASCGRGERIVCTGCRAGLILLDGPLCARCGAPTAWPVERCAECSGRRLSFVQARAAVRYDGPAPRLVGAWKEHGQRALTRELADVVAAVVAKPRAAQLTFVPGDAERTLWRGANTAEALARALAVRWELPVLSLVERRRPVGQQRGLSRRERRRNVRDAFAARPSPTRVAVVDDVYTTGATVAAVGTALRRAGASEIEIVTFARAVRR